jgi:CDP-diacylglycerol--serine O-phosphatidyltransferase
MSDDHREQLDPVAREKHRVARRSIYFLPNLITTAALYFGFFAIVQATKGNFELGASAIFAAMVLDALDGRVARLTKTTSDFGAEYDSLSDVIAFGLAPALVVYEWALYSMNRLGWLVAFIYVACTALRLARFNIRTVMDKRYFQGLPSPAGAAVLASWVWLIESYEFDASNLRYVTWALTLLVAGAMVSNIKFRSFKDMDLKGRVPFFALLPVVLFFVLLAFDAPLILFVIFFGYFISGPVLKAMRIRKIRRRRSQREQTGNGGL